MSRWALWSAHRYVQAGAAVPRCVGVDGRLLRRPWRMRSPAAIRGAQQVRAARSQPWWPRPLGVLCLGVAFIFALDPVGPIPTHVAASSSARTGPRLASVVLAHRADEPLARFRWQAGATQPPFAVVLFDVGYGEILRRDGIGDISWALDAEAAARLASGGTFHWQVVGDDRGRPAPSPLGSFEIPRPGTSGSTVR